MDELIPSNHSLPAGLWCSMPLYFVSFVRSSYSPLSKASLVWLSKFWDTVSRAPETSLSIRAASSRCHSFISGYPDWFTIKFSLFCTLPNCATIKPRFSPSSFSATFSTAELLFDTTRTVLSAISKLAMIFSMVCVLPVPGGPCMILTWCVKAASTAAFWLALHPKG